MTTTTLTLRQAQTYKLSMLFIAGNIVLPQLCHLVPGGGLTWLPIYFFTLIAAYRHGLVVGMVTAICSPLANNIAFGMPPAPMLPIIITKSVLLALTASAIAHKLKKATLLSLMLTVVIYQSAGSMAEWLYTGSQQAALQDLLIGWPGMIMQIVGGWGMLKIKN